MRLAAISLWLALATGTLAQFASPRDLAFWGRSDSVCAASPSPYIVWQGFECSPYDHGETWTLSAGGSAGMDPDYTAAPLAGLKSLRCASNAITQDANCPAFSAADELWSFFLFKAESLPASGFETIAAWQFGAGNMHANLSVNSDGTLRVASSSAGSTTDPIATNTLYYVWFHFKSGSGANGVIDVGFATTGTRPVAGNKFIELTGQSNSQDITQFSFMRYNGNPGQATYVFDNALISASQIGDNPP